MTSLPLGDYAVLSDCHSAALVSRAGSVDWLCCPRFDSPAFFAAILDPGAGHFAIHPAGPFQMTRAYADHTMVLETTFRTPDGTVVLTDAMALALVEQPHQLGEGAPGALLRHLACTAGAVDIDVTFAPRPEYGLVDPILDPVAGGIATRGGASRLVLSAPISLQVAGGTATARLSLTAGQTACFAVQHARAWDPPAGAMDAAQISTSLEHTVEAWRGWSVIHQTYDGPWTDLVRHSGRVLKALTFQPTGAIVAAPTTSLPEAVGGIRNWDYRYTWIRDACLTMDALWVAACPHEANKFFMFLADAAASQLQRGLDLQIMFGVGGERDLSERELTYLAGWHASKPVRVGNAAWQQRQIDVYGEMLNAAQRLFQQLGRLDDLTRQFLADAVDMAASRWREADQGIWEMRGEPRDFLYSKLMCWVALARGIELAPQLAAEDRVPAWTKARDDVAAAILERGWSHEAGAFTQAFGRSELDASSLMLTIMGFLPADDPRMKATIDAIATRLTDKRGLVYRYRDDDGLPSGEGTFLLCTFWLAQAQALAGDVDQAVATFERALTAINDVGLLAEEVDSGSGAMIGNFPQAFSHVGLINAAWSIRAAQAGATPADDGRQGDQHDGNASVHHRGRS
jgi:GH15 family glucan-1,4-alpha-glucosidase